MTPEQYIQQRLTSQQKWYSKNSGWNKKIFILIQTILIILASLVTAISVIKWEYLNYVTAILGALIAILTGVLSLNKYQDNWIEYRSASEALKREFFLFETNCAPYDIQDSFPLLVERVENILATQNLQWNEKGRKADNLIDVMAPVKKDEESLP